MRSVILPRYYTNMLNRLVQTVRRGSTSLQTLLTSENIAKAIQDTSIAALHTQAKPLTCSTQQRTVQKLLLPGHRSVLPCSLSTAAAAAAATPSPSSAPEQSSSLADLLDEDEDFMPLSRDSRAANLRNIKQDGSTRRFYKTVTITPEGKDGQYALRLGGVIAETPGEKPLILPNKAFARAVQLEFENQIEYIYPHTMPLTNIALTAIDRVPRERHFMEENIIGIFHYDATCYRESEEDTPALCKLQVKYWDPLLRWLHTNYNIEMKVSTALEATEVPEEHVTIIRNIIQNMDDWTFAIFESTVLLGKSVVIALAFMQNRLNIDQAYKAIRLEENYNLQVCGRVDGMYGTKLQEDHAKLRLASSRVALHLLKMKI